MTREYDHTPGEPTAAKLDELAQLARLYRDHPPPEPSEATWRAALGRVEARLAARPPARWRWRLLAGLAAAAVAAVLVARAPSRAAPTDPVPSAQAEDDEPFEVATAEEVNIIHMDACDADRVFVGAPLMGPFELAGSDDVEIEQVRPDPVEGKVPRVRRPAGGPMIIVSRGGGEEEP